MFGGWKSVSTLLIEPSRIVHYEPNAYFLPVVLPGGDSNSWGSYSSLEVFEDGRPLGPPHSPAEAIRTHGAGRYLHWITGVVMSTTDNSDPRTNGRKYSIRYAARPAAPEPIGHGAAILFSLTFAGAVVLNAGRFKRIRDRIAGVLSLCPSWYGLALAGVLMVAALSRLLWTRALQLPGVVSDSYGYFVPAVEHPLFPLSEMRPISVPYLISVALAVFRHPFGILVAHACFALLSAALLAIALRRRFGTPLTSLLVAVYILFCAKNIVLEHLLLSEHLARCLYLLFLAVLLGFWKPASHRMTGVLALLSVAAILTKPSAVILLPVFLGWLLLARVRAGLGGTPGLAQAAGVYLGIVGCLLGTYAYVNHRRFGFFGLSGMDGFVLYWHVHPLTRLDAGVYAEIKAEMRPFFQRYLEEHAEKGDYDGNWAVHGRLPAQSPAEIVKAYAQSHGEGSLFRRENEIFKRLALEAIRYRPRDYLILSLKGIRSLWNNGLNFWYTWQLLPFVPPSPQVDASWARERPPWFKYWSSASHSRWSARFDDDPKRRIDPWSPTMALPNLLTTVMTRWFRVIAWSGVLFGLIATIATWGAIGRGPRLIGLVPCAAVVVLYVVFCGFTIPAEPPRYLAQVQDLIVAIPLILIGLGVDVVYGIAKFEERKSALELEKHVSRDGEGT